MAKLKERVETLQGYLISESCTAKLWMQYMSYIDAIKSWKKLGRVILMLIRAGRNWDEHLAATEKILHTMQPQVTLTTLKVLGCIGRQWID